MEITTGTSLHQILYWDGTKTTPLIIRSGDRGVFPPMRYFRLRVDSVAGTDRWSYQTGYCMQFSRIEFLNGAGELFQYPSSTTATATNIGGAASSEDLKNCLDHKTSTKTCLTDCFAARTEPVYITFDMKSQCLDLTRYSRWQWWTANDTSGYPNRNLKTYSLEVSADGEDWITVDAVVDGHYTSSNYSLAYEGTIDIG